ncbi:HlyD family efflux transporter periplasmic adaptor subunit [Pendulispora brunnea]|uniref:HlyD family efflux transporter periplasmic adaptor subunit n=1 Tax=Pendulispora brunnea TaxID=2905690 RepID=A0ABZ2K9J6_9BACT
MKRPIILLALALFACSKPLEEPAEKSTPWVAVAKGKIDIEGGVIKLAASRDGLIKQVFVEEGANVKAGTPLAQLDDQQAALSATVANKELAQARAALASLEVRARAADREVRRLEGLTASSAAPKGELDRARDEQALVATDIAAARANIEVARARQALAAYEVSLRTVRAPLDGEVIRRYARPGDGVSTLNVTPLFLFAPDAKRIVRSELVDRFVDKVTPGMPAEVLVESDESQVYPAKVLRVGRVFGLKQPSDDPAEKVDQRVVECVLAIDSQEIRIGQRVLVRILPSAPTPEADRVRK